MNPTFQIFERCFTIFVWFYFTSAVFCESLYLSPDALATATPESNPFDPIFSKVQLGIYIVTIVLLLARWRSTVQILWQHKLMTLLLLLVLSTALWSDWPVESWRKGLNAFATGCFGVYVATRYSLKQQLQNIAIALGLATLFCWGFSLWAPGVAIEGGANAGSWRGPLTQKNLLARLMDLSVLCNLLLVWAGARGRSLYLVMLGLSAGLLWLSGSKTGLIVMLVLCLLLPLYRALRLKDSLLIPVLIATILVTGTASILVVSNWEALLQGLGRDPSLSGRTELWQQSWEFAMTRPWLGHGFRAFWQPAGEATRIWQALGYKPPHAHNGYINLALDMGVLGLGLFGLNLAWFYIRSIQHVRRYSGVLALLPVMYATFIFMYNHTESTVIEHNSIFWAEFVAISLSLL
ncbi:MAG: hypothetical protein RLZZ511_2262 [Cyanobacteriota bacterium]|jgi:O-antigen ligase